MYVLCMFVHTFLLLPIVHSIDDTDFSNPTVLFASFLRLPDIKFNFVKNRQLRCKMRINIYLNIIYIYTYVPVHNPTVSPEDLSCALTSV